MSNTKKLDEHWQPTREMLLDGQGRPLTQTLFLETTYDDRAVYTLKDIDHEWNGRVLPSMRRLYLEVGDPTEYQFATKYLLGWKHWLRICENKALRKHVDDWRFELEVKLRSMGVAQSIKQAKGGTWQAAKWLADRGWDQRGAGRPSKEDIEHEKKVRAAIADEFEADFARLKVVKG